MATSIEEFNLSNVHSSTECSGRTCIMHTPSNHHMRDWTLHWRGDRGLFERICRHGVGHPDPDQCEYWRLSGQEYMSVHGCCGCCVRGEL